MSAGARRIAGRRRAADRAAEGRAEPPAGPDGAAPWIPAAPAPGGPRSSRGRRGWIRIGVAREGGVPAVRQACARERPRPLRASREDEARAPALERAR